MKHYHLYAGLLAGSLAALTGVTLQLDRQAHPEHRNRADIRTGEGAGRQARTGIVAHDHSEPVHPPVPQPDYARPASYPSNGYAWDHFPITVYFDKSFAGHNADKILVVAGFNQWVEATNGRASYRLVDTKGADLIVRFSTTLRCGYTDSDCENKNGVKRMRRGDMHLGFLDADGVPIPPDVFQAAAAHEFGHVLGIILHSPYRSDLMYPDLQEQTKISPRDLATLNRIYNW